MNPRQGRLLSVAQLAKEQGIPKRTMHYRLKQLDELYGGKLIIKPKDGKGKFLIREDLLKLALLGLQKDQAPVPQYKFEELYEAVRQLKKQVNAYGARIRKLEAKATSVPCCDCKNT